MRYFKSFPPFLFEKSNTIEIAYGNMPESGIISIGLMNVITNFWLRGFNVSAISAMISEGGQRELCLRGDSNRLMGG
jgi:hypothetical protein